MPSGLRPPPWSRCRAHTGSPRAGLPAARRRSAPLPRRRRRWPARRPGHPAGRTSRPHRRSAPRSTGVGQHVGDRGAPACARARHNATSGSRRLPATASAAAGPMAATSGTWPYSSEAAPVQPAITRGAGCTCAATRLGEMPPFAPSSCANTCTRSSSRSSGSACASGSSGSAAASGDERRQLQHPCLVARSRCARSPRSASAFRWRGYSASAVAGPRAGSRAAPAPRVVRTHVVEAAARPAHQGGFELGLRPRPGQDRLRLRRRRCIASPNSPCCRWHRGIARSLRHAHRSRPSAVSASNAPSTRSGAGDRILQAVAARIR